MKKKDIFGKELKLTKKEKAKHKSRMEKFETLSLSVIQIQRLLEMLYKYLIHIGKSVFPDEKTKQKLYKTALWFVKQFVWFIVLPSIYQIISNILVSAYSNSFMFW